VRAWLAQGVGLPICYVWIDWLQSNALQAVDACQALRLHRIAPANSLADPGSMPDARQQQQQQAEQQVAQQAEQQPTQAGTQLQSAQAGAAVAQPPPVPGRQADAHAHVVHQPSHQTLPQQPKQSRTRQRKRSQQREQHESRQTAGASDAAGPSAAASSTLSPDAAAWSPSVPGARAQLRQADRHEQQPASRDTNQNGGAANEQQPASSSAEPGAGTSEGEVDADAAPDQAVSAADGAPAARLLDELCMQLMLYDAARSYSLFRQVRFAVVADADLQQSFQPTSPRNPFCRTPPQAPVDQIPAEHARCEWVCLAQGTWQCPVCFEDKPGVHCIRLDGCHHVFCEECVRTHAALHIKEGKLEALQCLEASCKERLSRQVLIHRSHTGTCLGWGPTWRPALRFAIEQHCPPEQL
jgi:hypothetical protein